MRGHDGAIRVIHINKHASRFATSCEAVSLPTLPPALFKRAILQAVAANAEYVPPYGSSAALYVRPVTYGTSATLNVLPADEALFCVFVSPINSLHGHEPLDALILEDFDRAAPRGTGGAKIGGNYAPMFRWVRQAKKQGFGITLHLDSLTRTHIDEFSTCGFIGVRRCPGGAFHLVVPVSESAMKSVTSEMCVEIAERRGWSVARRPVRLPLPCAPVRWLHQAFTPRNFADRGWGVRSHTQNCPPSTKCWRWGLQQSSCQLARLPDTRYMRRPPIHLTRRTPPMRLSSAICRLFSEASALILTGPPSFSPNPRVGFRQLRSLRPATRKQLLARNRIIPQHAQM